MKCLSTCFLVSLFLIACGEPPMDEKALVSSETVTPTDSTAKGPITDSAFFPDPIIPFWHSGIGEGDYQENWYFENEGTTVFKYPGFKVKIDGAFVQDDPYLKRDTLYLLEDVGWYFEGRKMWIESENDLDSFEIHLSVQQSINQVYTGDYNDMDWDKWESERYFSEERSQFYKLEDSAGYYRVPWVHQTGGFFYDRFIEQYNYDSTYFYRPGEMGGTTATFLVDEKPCMWWADYGIIRVLKRNEFGVRSTHYFKILYSYGC